jgi:hypothetical protein
MAPDFPGWIASSLLCGTHSGRFQAETPLIPPFRFSKPALLIMALAIYTAVSTGQGGAGTNPTPTKKGCEASAEKARAIEKLHSLPVVYNTSPSSYLTPRHSLPSGR